jgi:hypothetical protein
MNATLEAIYIKAQRQGACVKAGAPIGNKNASGAHVIWTDRDYNEHKKTFTTDPGGAAENALNKARSHKKKLEDDHAKSKYGSLRTVRIEQF